MAQPDCERYLKRERNHRAHNFKEECVGAISSATEALCLIYLWFQCLFSSTSAKGTVGKNFCTVINFQGRTDLRSECDFFFFLFSSYFLSKC